MSKEQIEKRIYYNEFMPTKVEFILNEQSLFSEVVEARFIAENNFIKSNKEYLENNNYIVETVTYIDVNSTNKVLFFHNIFDDKKDKVSIDFSNLKSV